MSGDRGKHVEKGPGEVAAFGPFRLFPTARRLERDDKPVEIGGRALDVLIELVEHAGRVVSKADLMAMIWADTTVVEGVLRTHVYNLRKALGDGVAGARYVTSVAGRGYCFVAPVIQSLGAAASTATPNAWTLAHGLPPPLARMTGRDEAVRALVAQLLEHRFVSVVGAGGIGKTTVAVAVGHALLDDFGGAVRFIELGSLTDPALLAATVASTLGMHVQADDALPSVHAFLHDKRVLLVLDNCEHLVDAAASLAEHLFLGAPRVHLLTTTREALRVEGEHAHRLGPLETPTEVAGMDADAVQTFPAVQVFLERAAASGWSGEVTDDDALIVAQTCRRLDGVPLAIELAASFAGRYGLRGIGAVLDDRLRLLSQQGRRTAPPRQRTLHALITWSYERLHEHERATLRRLSIFVGAFSFDAARAVVLEGSDSVGSLAELMNTLVGKSLLSVSVQDGAVVYRLLETTRVYALERLIDDGELESVSLRHALFFTERLTHANDLAEPLRKQASDLANVRAALPWCFSSVSGHAAGVRLAAAAVQMLLELGLVSECRQWCRQALDVMGQSETGTLVELGLQEAFAISTMFSRGNGDEARDALARGVDLARSLGGGSHETRLLGHLTSFRIRTGDFRGAVEVAEQYVAAAPIAPSAETVRAHWMLALSHHFIGDQTLAQQCYEAGHAAFSGVPPTTAYRQPHAFFRHPQALATLARTLWLRGHAQRAVTLARQVIDEVAMPSHPVEKCSLLILCEAIFIWNGEWEEARDHLDVLSAHVERHSLASHVGMAMALRGELLVKTGRPEEGCRLLRRAASALKDVSNASLDTAFAGALAEGLAATDELRDALSTVESAIMEAEHRGGTFNLPELLRIKGVLLASRSPTDASIVDDTLSRAVEVARRQGALTWELRATMELARGRLKRDGAAEHLRDLSVVCAKFTDGMQAPDLQAARKLLEHHAGRRRGGSMDCGITGPEGTRAR
jgi:predicted ATPase/DNA-binding winged helix-turn-helix (wHTH) protein